MSNLAATQPAHIRELLRAFTNELNALTDEFEAAVEEALQPPVEAPPAWQHQDIDVQPAERASILIVDEVVRDELPDTVFGFNLRHISVQNDLFKDGAFHARSLEFLKAFPGALYRYPGGLMSNHFWWQRAVGQNQNRLPQATTKAAGGEVRTVLFGPDEFMSVVEQTGGEPVYVLNLLGYHETDSLHELSAEEMADSNANLAQRLKGDVKLYQLGNELDRAEYQWPHDKYIKRARATMDAVLDVDPEARFIAFLRDFDWQYRGDAGTGKSRYQDFIGDVLDGLPEVTDFSMQFYYDDPGMEDVQTKNLTWRLRQYQRAMQAASEQRDGNALNVWITEHARGINLGAGKPTKDRGPLTSNQQGAISTADFLISLAQLPSVQGAALWGANATPWELFDAHHEHNDLRPRPTYWALRVLRDLKLPVVLRTRTESPNASGYAGGYDVRAVAFRDSCGEQLGLWAVNRSASEQPVAVTYAPFARRAVTVRHAFAAGRAGVDTDVTAQSVELEPQESQQTFSALGVIELRLPPSSVSSFRFG
ncbi:MAG: hypothetical protein H0W33_03555 [Gammaproteobacteria bacterium]|nr:hypothetical protein [Gammaproteobacteria bacterium]